MWVGVTACVLVVVLLGLVLAPRPQTPLLFDLGASLTVIGMLGVADSVFTHQACSPSAIAFRWAFSASGLALLVAGYVQALRK